MIPRSGARCRPDDEARASPPRTISRPEQIALFADVVPSARAAADAGRRHRATSRCRLAPVRAYRGHDDASAERPRASAASSSTAMPRARCWSMRRGGGVTNSEKSGDVRSRSTTLGKRRRRPVPAAPRGSRPARACDSAARAHDRPRR
eukprot:31141-Pelagococcus_subviridis.AAC.8